MRRVSRATTTWLWFLIVTLFSPLSGLGRDADGLYAIVGIGNHACGQFVEARRQRRDVAYVDWLGGYVTAVNAVSDETFNIMGQTDFAGLMRWLDQYCGQHALHPFARAVNVLMADGLFNQRTTKLRSQTP